MTEPQQPEIARSRRSAATDSAAKAKTSARVTPAAGARGPIPEDNLPGHHPQIEQDKPVGPPPTPRPQPKKTAPPPPVYRSRLRRAEPFATVSRAFGVTEESAFVRVEGEQLEIRFGPWHLITPLSNVTGASVTGPFHWWKVVGPPHLSFKDRGVTFATAADRGVCIQFLDPVPAIDPRGLLRHPAATVTVENPDELARLLNQQAA